MISDTFWFWNFWCSPSSWQKSKETNISVDECSLSKCKTKSSASASSQLRKRMRKRSLPNISKNLDKMLNEITNNVWFMIKGRKKTMRGTHNGASIRRSKFMGVSRNGNHWQTLINVDRKKRYINTFTSELEAAITFDFYSIGIHGWNAKTNFSYNGEFLMQMISSFKSSDGNFDPSDFVQAIEVQQVI